MTRQVGDELVVLDLASGIYFGLDAIGARIWKLITENKTFGEICDVMTDEFDVSRPDFERDLDTLMDDLRDKGLVTTAAS